MKVSEIAELIEDLGPFKIRGEREFERFSRTTSKTVVPVCVFVASQKYVDTIPANASMVITTPEIGGSLDALRFGLCLTDEPKRMFFKLLGASALNTSEAASCIQVGENCSISKLAYVSPRNVEIGNNVVIEEFASVYDNVVIGDNCVIRAGSRVGCQDYNYFDDRGVTVHIAHKGGVRLSEGVELGCNSVIGKALYQEDDTVIGRNCKIGNNAVIGHDCVIGDDVMIYGGVLIAGHVSIGNNASVYISATVKNGLSVGAGAKVGMGACVISNVGEAATVLGNPARIVR